MDQLAGLLMIVASIASMVWAGIDCTRNAQPKEDLYD